MVSRRRAQLAWGNLPTIVRIRPAASRNGSYRTELLPYRPSDRRSEIVGTYIDGSTRQFRGFIEKDGMFTSFDAPGGNRTFPSGVNNRGQIVGGIQIDRIPVGSFLATPSEN
jgi:hypothetical protein